jgi:hypothetical protein
MVGVMIFHEAFDAKFLSFPQDVQTALAAKAHLLESIGPTLGRPHVDTLKNSKHSNMNELPFDAAGGGEARFYRSLITTAGKRFDDHLAAQEGNG